MSTVKSSPPAIVLDFAHKFCLISQRERNYLVLAIHRFSIDLKTIIFTSVAVRAGKNFLFFFLFPIGIFFKYDLSSIMVRVESRRRSFWGFLVRLCGIVGGIFATSGELYILLLCLIRPIH